MSPRRLYPVSPRGLGAVDSLPNAVADRSPSVHRQGLVAVGSRARSAVPRHASHGTEKVKSLPRSLARPERMSRRCHLVLGPTRRVGDACLGATLIYTVLREPVRRYAGHVEAQLLGAVKASPAPATRPDGADDSPWPPTGLVDFTSDDHAPYSVLACPYDTMRTVTDQQQHEYEWADDLPEGCPPLTAAPVSGVYYRVVKSIPFSARDFRRPRDLPRREPFSAAQLCRASALSLYGSLSDAQKAIRYIPGFRNRKLASASLSPVHGVTEVNESRLPQAVLKSHTSWWVPVTVTPSSLFSAVSGE